jgi:hypothetical protein
MALFETLAELEGNSPAKKNRVDLLLDKLSTTMPDDHATLLAALQNKTLRSVVLTKALRQEYGIATVTDTSVSHWRRKNLGEVDGL